MANTVDKVITVAQAEVGYLEKKSNALLDDKTANAGSGNYTKYWRDIYPSYQGSYWCLCFVVWSFVKAYGAAAAKKLLCMSNYTFYTPTSGQWFYNKGQFYTKDPKIGDVIFFRSDAYEAQGRWRGIHHVGIVYKVSSGYVYTIEGNTSTGSQVIPNGGSVCMKQYKIGAKEIAGYGRPEYTVNKAPVDIPIVVGRAGLKLVGVDSLNIRKTPIDGSIVGTCRKGELVMATAKTLASDGSYWFKTSKGYVSGKYFEGWVKEPNQRWWYIQQGYTYPAATLKKIDGKWYAFDEEGYMLEANNFNTDGSIK